MRELWSDPNLEADGLPIDRLLVALDPVDNPSVEDLGARSATRPIMMLWTALARSGKWTRQTMPLAMATIYTLVDERKPRAALAQARLRPLRRDSRLRS